MSSGLDVPCFVLGPHRSGTTILTQALAESGAFVYLTAAHIVAQHRGADQAAPTLVELAQRHATRGIDAVAVAEDLPEEYGFLLPGRRLTRETAPKLASVYGELVASDGRERRPLLRNPWDLDRAPLILEHFPRASFVFVVRNPVATINSQLQAVRTLLAEPSEYHALLDSRYRRLVRRKRLFRLYRRVTARGIMASLLLKSFQRSTDGLVRDLRALPRERWTVVKYEELIDDPARALVRVYGFLGLLPGPIPLAERIRPGGRELDPHVEARIGRIRQRTRSFGETFGYGSQDA
ncbi:hypothetical protein BH20GEM1_BH20GEM1_04800 [soil metagenome]